VASLNHFSLSYPVPNKDPPYIEPANHELERSRELRRLDRSASPSVGRGIASTRCTEDRVSDRRIVGWWLHGVRQLGASLLQTRHHRHS